MNESWQSRLWRIAANLNPAYRGSGARITAIAADFREVHIELPLGRRTRNHHGMIWGGSLYAALDPVYGVMLGRLLGKEYFVVDRAAHIHFLRPARTTVTARFAIDEAEWECIQELLARQDKVDRRYDVELRDRDGQVCVQCEKVVHIRRVQVCAP